MTERLHRLTVEIDKYLRQELKAKAAKEGKTIKGKIVEFINQYITKGDNDGKQGIDGTNGE